jgi:hypothetical protein
MVRVASTVVDGRSLAFEMSHRVQRFNEQFSTGNFVETVCTMLKSGYKLAAFSQNSYNIQLLLEVDEGTVPEKRFTHRPPSTTKPLNLHHSSTI